MKKKKIISISWESIHWRNNANNWFYLLFRFLAYFSKKILMTLPVQKEPARRGTPPFCFVVIVALRQKGSDQRHTLFLVVLFLCKRLEFFVFNGNVWFFYLFVGDFLWIIRKDNCYNFLKRFGNFLRGWWLWFWKNLMV